MSKKLSYALGAYLAEYLVLNRIPSLSCNQSTSNVIQVTIAEADELKRLGDIWYSKRCSNTKLSEEESHKISEKEWNDSLKYSYLLKEKYLPHTLKIDVPHIDFSNEKINKEIKKGLIDALWDWDFCEWSLKPEDILLETEVRKFGENDKYSMTHSYVTLKLSLEAPNSFTGGEWIEIKTKQKK